MYSPAFGISYRKTHKITLEVHDLNIICNGGNNQFEELKLKIKNSNKKKIQGDIFDEHD